MVLMMKFKTRIRHHFAGQHTFRGRPLLDRYSTVTRPLLDRYATVTRPLRDRYTPFSCRIDICLGLGHGYVISHRDICLWLCDIRHRYLPTYRAICMPRATAARPPMPPFHTRAARPPSSRHRRPPADASFSATGPQVTFEGLTFELKVPSLGTFRRSPRESRDRVRKVTEIAEDWYHARVQASRRCRMTHR